jgi:hypothetical protein
LHSRSLTDAPRLTDRRRREVRPPDQHRKRELENYEAYGRALPGELVWESFSVAGTYLLGIADALYPHTAYHGSH